MKIKILLAVVGITAICGGKGVAAGTVVGPIRAPTSATPAPATSQAPGLTMPATSTTVNSPINPNMTGAIYGNGYATNGEFNGYANTNSIYSFGNTPGGSITPPSGANIHLPDGNLLPTAHSPLPATVAPPPGANVPSTIIPPPNANSPATIVPPSAANSPQTPAKAPSPGVNSTPPNP